MARAWAWFYKPSAVLSLVQELGDENRISVLFRDPEEQKDVIVIGPITREMACYPFLDVRHQIRRFISKKAIAEHYARVLARGGAVVCIDTPDDGTFRTLGELHAHDVLA